MKADSFSSKALLLFLATIVLSLVFAMYFAPEMVVAISNQFLAMCGW